MHFHMVCQKRRENSVSEWGSLQESSLFDHIGSYRYGGADEVFVSRLVHTMMLVPQSFVSVTMSRDWGLPYTITSVRDQHQLMIVRGTQAIHGCVRKWRIPQNGQFRW